VTLRSSALRNASTLLSVRPLAVERALVAALRLAVVLRFVAVLPRVDLDPLDLVAIFAPPYGMPYPGLSHYLRRCVSHLGGWRRRCHTNAALTGA
jgi:hypothetical protein